MKTNLYIVGVSLEKLDNLSVEGDSIATTYVPVEADSEESAKKKAVVWQSDGGKAVENDELLWECREKERALVWKAFKVISNVSKSDFDSFLSLTQGFSVATVCR